LTCAMTLSEHFRSAFNLAARITNLAEGTFQRLFLIVVALSALMLPATSAHQAARQGLWTFAVSGSSRNCGDVVMPVISKEAIEHNIAFFWHLGTYRNIYRPDEDFEQAAGTPVKNADYYDEAWNDFIQNQLGPFGSVPVFLTRGNHEAIPPKSSEDFIRQFGDWLNADPIRKQRLQDNPLDHELRTYYHWIQGNIDFITLDNSTSNFDAQQLVWFENTLRRDTRAENVKSLVVGMHIPLPESIAKQHSMNQSAEGTESGRRAYYDLLKFRSETNKRIYILASYNNFYASNIFNSAFWRDHDGVLPGWIIGTAGSIRYPLPPEAIESAADAVTNVYGYLLGSVSPDGAIEFDFHRVSEEDVPPSVIRKYSPNFVHWCFVQNSQIR